MFKFLLPSNWSKKYSLAGVVCMWVFTLITTTPAATWQQTVVQCVAIAATCGLAAVYVSVQGAADTEKAKNGLPPKQP